VTGRDPQLEHRLRLFRDHGIERDPRRMTGPVPGPWHYELQLLGHNLRLSDLHAALGRSQLAKLGRFLGRRRLLAARYDRLLAGLPGVRPGVAPGRAAGAAYHLYTVQMDFTELGLERREVMGALRAEGIGTQVHYIPLPAQPYYRSLGADPEEYPGARRYFERTLSLPLFPAMRDEDVDRVVGALSGVLARPSGRRG
jgi:dTDP-4-amino-4,6-dideoxygalactose transaminase